MPYKCFENQGHVKQNLTNHAYCLLSCQQFNMEFFPLLGQGHQNEHICHAQVYHRAKFECHSLNIV